MIILTLGVKEHEGFVYFLHSWMPIFLHKIGDLPKFRYIIINLLLQGLCSNQYIADTFYVFTKCVRRWKHILNEKAESAFFTVESRHGWSHKLLHNLLDRIQVKLNKCQIVNSIAKEEEEEEEGLSEGSIRAALKLGH
jgi:hypothetical protein